MAKDEIIVPASDRCLALTRTLRGRAAESDVGILTLTSGEVMRLCNMLETADSGLRSLEAGRGSLTERWRTASALSMWMLIFAVVNHSYALWYWLS